MIQKKPRRIRYLSVVAVLALISLTYAIGSQQINQTVDKMVQEENQNRVRLAEIQKEKLALETELSISGTDAYIENQARTKYGFLKPGEIRFVITNPEALYGDGEELPKVEMEQTSTNQ